MGARTKFNSPLNNLSFRGIDRVGFVGRDEDLVKLHELLKSQVRKLPIALVTGMAGVGKSELTIQYVKLHEADFGGGVAWFAASDFREGVRDFIQANFMSDLDLRYSNKLDEGWKAWQDFCGDSRSALIVIDDVTDYHKEIAPYLPKSWGDHCPFQFVMTSRERLRGNIATLEIRELELDAAVSLFQSWAEQNPSAIANPPMVKKLCQRLGCLPLALTLAGSWLSDRERTLEMLIKALEREGLSTAALEPDAKDIRQTAKQGLMATIAVSWDSLSPSARQLARVLSLFAAEDLPWDLVESTIAAYGQSPRQERVILNLPQKIWRWLRRLLGLRVQSLFVNLPFVPIHNAFETRISLRQSSMLQCLEENKTYKLHSLLHEFFAKQWADSDLDGWMIAMVEAMSASAREIPDSPSWEDVQKWQILRPHLEISKENVHSLRQSASNPAAIQIYKSQYQDLAIGFTRLQQSLYFEATYRSAIADHDLANTHRAEGKTTEAQEYFDKALVGYKAAIEQARKALPKDSMILASYLHKISILFNELGNYREGIPPAEEAVKIAKRKASPLRLASYCDNLGWLYHLQGRYAEAVPLFKQALTLRQELLGDRHLDVGSSLNNLAALYDSQGRYEEAEPLYQQALALSQELLGDRHPSVATSLNNLAGLYESQGRYEEAEPLYQQALALRQELLGDRHPDVASSINNLAWLYKSQGRYEEAEPLYQQALALRQELLGDRHPDVASSINNLAWLYKSQGRYEEAEPLYQQALALRQELLGDRHPDVASSINNLAWLYKSQGRYEEAEPLYQQALALRQELLGDRHPDVATSINGLAELYKLQGRYEEAKPLFKQALTLRQELLGDRHPDVATSINGLAELYKSQEKYEEAEPLYIQALTMRQELLGDRHPDVATSINGLAELYKSQEKYEEAEPLYIQALTMRQELLGDRHPDVATSIKGLAEMYKLQGRYEEAESLYKEH